MSHDLSQEFLRVVEEAAIASAQPWAKVKETWLTRWPLNSMRCEMDLVPMNETIVIGGGKRDQAPMLYIGDNVGFRSKFLVMRVFR